MTTLTPVQDSATGCGKSQWAAFKISDLNGQFLFCELTILSSVLYKFNYR